METPATARKVVTHEVRYEYAGIPDIVFRRYRGIPDEQIIVDGSLCLGDVEMVIQVLLEWSKSPKEFWVLENPEPKTYTEATEEELTLDR